MGRINKSVANNNNINEENSAASITGNISIAGTNSTIANITTDIIRATDTASAYKTGKADTNQNQNASDASNGNICANIYYFWKQKIHMLISYLKE